MIRLLSYDSDGKLVFREFEGRNVPPYAILSHTWDADNSKEVIYDDVLAGKASQKPGYRKVEFCAKQARGDGLDYFWIDTCCINKRSETEVTEAINSMFRWYRNADRCYVYLSDVAVQPNREEIVGYDDSVLRKSRWFKRGWTLQELLAPKQVELFAHCGERLGDKASLERVLHEITGIAVEALRGDPLAQFSLSERSQWAAERETTRAEDAAYCMLGIFGITMPLIYGEGRTRALARLHQEEARLRYGTHGDDESAPKRRRTAETAEQGSSLHQTPSIQEIIEFLQYDEMEDRFENIRPSLHKTCNWFLDTPEYKDWLRVDDYYKHHGFFWIKGKPGCGKSTLVKFALSSIRKNHTSNDIVLSFFFNARGAEVEKSVAGLYRSLLVQLLRAWEGPTHERKPFEAWRLRPNLKSNAEKLREWLRQTMTLIRQNIIVVIDALDECDEDDVRDMIGLFEDLGEDASANGWAFRVLFSSRHYPHISAQRSLELILENQSGHARDIEHYVSSKTKGLKGKTAVALRGEIIDRSSGIFLWVVLVTDILNKHADSGHVHKLRQKLKDIPKDLNTLIQSILSRDTENLPVMRLCLQWLLYAVRPLTREELYHAVLCNLDGEDQVPPDELREASIEDMDRFILSASKGLAETTKVKSKTVQFIHESVRDFLLKEHGMDQLWVDLASNAAGQSHDRLKRCCLRYIELGSSGRVHIPHDLPAAKSREMRELRENVNTAYPFLRYSVENLLRHAENAQATGINQFSFLFRFQSSSWRSTYNLMEKHQIRRLDSKIDLLYILALLNCPQLISSTKAVDPAAYVSHGRYDNPIFAAMAANNIDALVALRTLDRQRSADSMLFLWPRNNILTFLVNQTPAMADWFLSSYDPSSIPRKAVTAELLVQAAERGHLQLLEYFFEDDDIIDNARRNILAELSNKGLVEPIKLLLKGHDRNRLRPALNVAVVQAAMNGHDAVIDMLLDAGACINADDTINGSPLYAALSHQQPETATMLSEKGADGVGACQTAINRNNFPAFLLAKVLGLNPPLQRQYYNQLLVMAASHGDGGIVQLSLNHGADANAKDRNRITALGAATVRRDLQLAQLLIDRGANVDTREQQTCVLLTMAASDGLDKLVKALLAQGIDVDTQNGSPLRCASRGGFVSTVRLLLGAGADPNAHCKVFGTALHAAIARGHLEIVRLLLDHGTNVNIKDGQSDCALYTACRHCQTPIIKLLLDRGATTDDTVKLLLTSDLMDQHQHESGVPP